MSDRFDAIMIGAGHNGLVTACYLARAGWKVLVLERRHVVGGACVTEEVFPGYKVSTAAYVNSLFRKEIVRDLRLADFGFEVLERNPSSFTPFPDGQHLFLGPDGAMNRREIAKFSLRDAENYPKYEALLNRVAEAVEPTLADAAAEPAAAGPARPVGACSSWSRRWRRLGATAGEAVEILTGIGPRRSSIAGSSPTTSRRRWPPTPSSGRPRRRPCPARPTSSSTTSWARPTASAASGPTCGAAWAD